MIDLFGKVYVEQAGWGFQVVLSNQESRQIQYILNVSATIEAAIASIGTIIPEEISKFIAIWFYASAATTEIISQTINYQDNGNGVALRLSINKGAGIYSN